ncbi:MAG: Ig-like domain-containing protein, partial [Pseudomonadota bacterium]
MSDGTPVFDPDKPVPLSQAREELARGIGLINEAQSQITIVGNFINPVLVMNASFNLFRAKNAEVVDKLEGTEKALTLAARAPYIGGVVKLYLKAAKFVKRPIVSVDDALDELKTPFDLVATPFGLLSTALTFSTAALLITRRDYQDRIEAIDAFLAGDLSGEPMPEMRAEDFNRLFQNNERTAAHLDRTREDFERVAFMDVTPFELAQSLFEQADASLDGLSRTLDAVSAPVEAINKALEPVADVLDAAQDVVDRLVDPIVEAVLDATGLDDVLRSLADRLNPAAGLFDELTESLRGVRDAFDRFDVEARISAYWDEFELAFDVDGAFWAMDNLGALTADRAEGTGLVLLGSGDADTLTGTDKDDLIAPLSGDDVVEAGGGLDTVVYVNRIETYRVELLPGAAPQDIEVASRDPSTAAEGTDVLTDVEFLTFSNPGLGPVAREEIENFRYVSGSAPFFGGDGRQWIFGDGGRNILSADGGADYVFGGGGDDDIDGGAGDDYLDGGDGDDDIDGGAGDADLIFGGDGDDLARLDGADAADLGAGDDEARLSAGAHSVDGGDGRDSLVLEDQATVDLGAGSVDFGSGVEALVLGFEEIRTSDASDVIILAAGAQTVYTAGEDEVRRLGPDDTVLHIAQSSLQPLSGAPRVSFEGGGLQGVKLLHSSETIREPNKGPVIAAYPNAAYVMDASLGTEDFDLGGPEGQIQAQIIGANVYRGTRFADAFFAYDLQRGAGDNDDLFVIEEDGAPIQLDGETLEFNGSAFYGLAGPDVFYASQATSYFNGGEDFDLVNFSLDGIDRGSGTGGINNIDADLRTGIAQERNSGDAVWILRGIEGLVGTAKRDVLHGNDEANYLAGQGNQDEIFGYDGADYLDGMGGFRSQLYGGAGDDVVKLYFADEATADGGADVDTLDLGEDQPFRLDLLYDDRTPTGVEGEEVEGWQVDLIAGTASTVTTQFKNAPDGVPRNPYENIVLNFENVLGGALDDEIIGTVDDNYLGGRDGDDQIYGGDGDDGLSGGAGQDSIWAGDGNDVLIAGLGRDYLFGGEGDDHLFGLEAGQTDDGFNATNFLFGGEGADLFVAGPAPSLPDDEPIFPTPLPGPFDIYRSNAGQSGVSWIADFTPGQDLIDLRLTPAESFADLRIYAQYFDGGPTIGAPGFPTAYYDLFGYVLEVAGRVVAFITDFEDRDFPDRWTPTEADFVFGAGARDDEIDVQHGDVDSPLDVLANDAPSTLAAQLSVISIDGEDIAPGETVLLPSGGEVRMDAAGALFYRQGEVPDLYQPGGIDGFVYEVQDDVGMIRQARADLTIGLPDVPQLGEDPVVQGFEDTPTDLDPLANDLGDELQIVSAVSANGWSVEILPGGGLRHAAPQNAFGEDRVSYTVRDAQGDEASGEIAVNVAPVNDLPEVGDDDFAGLVATDGPFFLDLLANDSDQETPDDLTIVDVTYDWLGSFEFRSGDVTINDDGTVTYAPSAFAQALFDDEIFFERFRYTVRDADGGETEGT